MTVIYYIILYYIILYYIILYYIILYYIILYYSIYSTQRDVSLENFVTVINYNWQVQTKNLDFYIKYRVLHFS